MAGRFVVRYFGTENIFGADDLIVAAIEHVVRKRLTEGKSMWFGATGHEISGRARVSTILTPQTHCLFTYTDPIETQLEATIEELQRHVDTYGGIELDENDLPVEPAR